MRAVLVDTEGRVLLQAYLDPTVHTPGGVPHTEPMWIAPGGGLAPGETPEAGLERELREETGLTAVAWGPWLWRRTVELFFQGRWRRFEERYRLGRVPTARPPIVPQALDAHEHTVLRGHRWWALPDLAATREVVYPPRLAIRLAELLRAGPPGAPVDISHEG